MYDLIAFFVLLLAGYFFGKRAETKHFKSIIQREKKYRRLLCFSERLPQAQTKPVKVALVGGNVVIANDYFKQVGARLRNFFGGRMTSYESLIERARREAILRMKEDASKLGASSVINVKIETASISKGGRGQIGSVEAYAYGTAIINLR
ncbi:MAG TPA: heavy metal-binding domain-containing protein [Crenotrichaceae bacterium]|nr:heavy metal-binding domain-containing protein [Crenotrichaceae bacterium]